MDLLRDSIQTSGSLVSSISYAPKRIGDKEKQAQQTGLAGRRRSHVMGLKGCVQAWGEAWQELQSCCIGATPLEIKVVDEK